MDKDWMFAWTVVVAIIVSAACLVVSDKRTRRELHTHAQQLQALQASLSALKTTQVTATSTSSGDYNAITVELKAEAAATRAEADAAHAEAEAAQHALTEMGGDLTTARSRINTASEVIARQRKAYDALKTQHDTLSQAFVACSPVTKE